MGVTAIARPASHPERTTTRSAATRAKLVNVAERLFAARGIDGVTLNEIGEAASQRNAAVCQYHFGSKAGLLQAIIDKHVPGIAARRYALLDELERIRRPGLREVVRAFVLPVAEKLRDPDGGREFILINAQLVAIHTASLQHLGASSLEVPTVDRLTRTLQRVMAPYRLPPAVLKQRAMLSAALLFHGLADHLRMQEVVKRRDASMDTELFVQTLEDALVALLAGGTSAPQRPGVER